ncbi:type 2 lanthipeptide synthetase LanM family protein [soil metagenome]
MPAFPFNDQFKLFVDSKINFPNEDVKLLEEIHNISKFVVDKDYTTFLSEYFPLLDFFPAQRNELIGKNALVRAYEQAFDVKQLFLKSGHLETVLTHKINSKEQFEATVLHHLQQDKALLSKIFNITDFTVKSIQHGLGDVHQGGKSTSIITFENDFKVVYKPRPAGLDIAFNKLIEAFNSVENTTTLKTIRFIERKKYCWCEFIDNTPCSSLIELESYYVKTGVLIAFMYFLQGTDMHLENIIAHGDSPVLIDIECLFSNTEIGYFDILNTGLVPILSLIPTEKEAVDLSGLGAAGDIKMGKQFWKWQNLDSDALSLEKDYGYVRARGNQPVYKNEIISPEKYTDKIVCGFEMVSNWIFTIQPHLNDDKKNPFLQFKNQVFRIIPRMTQEYHNILENSFTPAALQDKPSRENMIRKNLFDFPLRLPFIDPVLKSKIIESELAAIERLDVPYFSANTSDLYISESGDVVLENYFTTTPYQAIFNKLKTYDRKEADHQKKHLQSAFAIRYNLQYFHSPSIESATNGKKTNSKPGIADEIKSIADNLHKNIVVNGNEITWTCFVEDNGQVLFNLMDSSLYSGKIGVAIFLAGVSTYMKETKYDKAVDSIVKAEIDAFLNATKAINISFSTGVAGLIYALLKIDPVKYTGIAIQLSELITVAEIKEDRSLDIMGGSAGCLNTLCELYSVSKSGSVLKKCLLLGNHLMENRLLDKASSKKCWNSSTGSPLTGYSHGAAGIGLSLLKLYEISGDNKFKAAFYEALEYENYYYNASRKNWRDLRSGEEKYQNSWCHGAAGIGLARIAAYKILKDETLLTDIYNAVEATKEISLLNSDHYCCGNIGRIAFLIEASELLQEKELKSRCSDLIKSVIAKKNELGYYQTYQNPNISAENPSLFKGTSGIGYILLKYHLHNKMDGLG